MVKLAIDGGQPVRSTLLPYGRQQIDEADIQAVVDVLRSDWLTTGPKVAEFEAKFAEKVGAAYAVAVNSGTAALHAAMYALDIQAGDEVIVPAITFVASANCVVYQGGTPVFADVEPDTLLLNAAQVEAKITPRTKAIIAVDYAGQPCDYDALRAIAAKYHLALVDDAAHALGGGYKGKPVGTLADLNTFSLHPVKHITTGEGGIITTNEATLAQRMRHFRNHGITSDHRQRAEQGAFFYEMVGLGYNYRITDFQCVLGISQLKKLSGWVTRRQNLAARYDTAFAKNPLVQPLSVRSNGVHAYHLYVVKLNLPALRVDRQAVFGALRAEGIGVNVHYIPVHLHPYYRQTFSTAAGDCPVAETAYEQIITLPVFPAMTDADVGDVVAVMDKVLYHFRG